MAGLIVVAVVGIIAFIVGWIWMARIAFKESNGQGVLCLLVPFYAVYYAITRWANAKKPFIIVLVGLVALVGGFVPTIMGVKSEVEPVIVEFMQAGVLQDADRAYTCCHASISREELRNFIMNNYDLFEGFKDITMSGFSVQTTAGITTADFSGAVIYSGDVRLPLEASLVKENDIWKITEIYIGY